MLKKLLLPISLSTLLMATSWAQTLDGMFSTPTKMTDEQAKAAQEFNHEGRKARIVKEGCEAKLGKDGCDESNIDANGAIFKGGTGAALEQHIGKLYGVIFGAGFLTGSGPKITTKEKGSAKLSQADRKELNKNGSIANEGKEGNRAEKKNDYCIYGALGYELIAGMMQTTQQKQHSNAAITDPQLQALISLKQAHKTRKRTATYQAVIYGATSACYIARAAASKGTVVMDTSYIAKMAGATALAGLYGKKASKHASAEKSVQKVIDSLPKSGDCNPYTGTACFCKEESSKNLYPGEYQEVCVLNNGNFDSPIADLGCGVLKNGVMSFDKDCACKKNNTCFKASLTAYNPSFSLGSNMMNDANKGYDLLSNGTFDQGKFDAYSLSNNAMAKKIKSKLDTSGVPALNLTDAQKNIANDLKDLMPGNLAGVAAATDPMSPPGGGLMGESSGAQLAALSPEIKNKLDFETKSNYKTGSGFNADFSEPDTITLPSMTGETQIDNNTEVLSFAEKAINQADVTKSEETPIFDIISHRYRSSGWRKLQAVE